MENYLSLVKDGPCQLPPADVCNLFLGVNISRFSYHVRLRKVMTKNNSFLNYILFLTEYY